MRVVKFVAILLLINLGLLYSRTAPESAVTVQNEFKKAEQTIGSRVVYPEPDRLNRVHRAGMLWMNITNCGWFGNSSTDDQLKDPCTGVVAPPSEFPGGSRNQYLFVGSLMFGGYLGSTATDNSIKFNGPFVSTGYEGWSGGYNNNQMMELWPTGYDMTSEYKTSHDDMKLMKETSNIKGRKNCYLEDTYRANATAEEQFNALYTDKFLETAPGAYAKDYLSYDDYQEEAKGKHRPLGIEVRQKSYAWSYEYAQKFVIIDYTLYNRNDDRNAIYNMFMGVYFDCDIGTRTGANEYHADDLAGFISKANIIDEQTGLTKNVNLNLAWAADNDGRNYTGTDQTGVTEPGPGAAITGASSVVTVRVLRNPNPKLRYSYNMYVAKSGENEPNGEWGPMWAVSTPTNPLGFHNNSSNPNTFWKYDLTYKQYGYSDGRDGDPYCTKNWDNGSGQEAGPADYEVFKLKGGLTEGRPITDVGRYMVMSNREFDFDQTDIMKDVHPDPEGTPLEDQQVDRWKNWDANDGPEDGAGGRKDLSNGADIKTIMSFGPLGFEETVNMQTINGNIQKEVSKFAYGDSIKLTLAFIVNDNFHVDPMQNPTTIDTKKFNWGDALKNVLWAERVYDIPLYDSPVKFKDPITGVTEQKRDGYYGEDVGKDGLYGTKDGSGQQVSWWMPKTGTGTNGNQLYLTSDAGEGNFELDALNSAYTDPYGYSVDSEDKIARYGNSGNPADGGYIQTVGGNGELAIGPTYYVKNNIKFNAFGAIEDRKIKGEATVDRVRIGYKDSLMTAGDGVADFTGPPPPPSPKIKISTLDNDITIVWTSDNFGDKESSSENYVDQFSRRKDFEGYQVWISKTAMTGDFIEIFNCDRVNYIYERVDFPGKYWDIPIPADTINANPNKYPVINNSLSAQVYRLVPFMSNRDMTKSYDDPNGSYSYRAVYKTEGTRNYWEYKFTLKNKPMGIDYYIAVTASDFGDPKSGTPWLKSSPAQNATLVNPGKTSGKDEIIVVPNPYRADVDYEAAQWESPSNGVTWDENADRKISFMNVPAHCLIRIYTLAGDLVKTIAFNGDALTTNLQNEEKKNTANWNLLNDNSQAVTSGIYLFSVQEFDSGKKKYADSYKVGKFVIVK